MHLCQDLIYDVLDLRLADIIAQGMGQEPSEVDEFEAKIRAEIEKKPPFGFKDLDISGDDIMSVFHLTPGPLIGDILDDLLEMVLDNPSANNYDMLIARAAQYLAGKSGSSKNPGISEGERGSDSFPEQSEQPDE